MTTYLVLTIIGNDQPGLVERLAQTIADNGGNWLESSMSQLAGKFAGILQVSVADSDADRLIAELHKLSDRLKLVIEKATVEPVQVPARTLNLSLVGNDRPGIIKEIARTLAGLSINVEDLDTECVPAPMSADVLFKARAVLKAPTDLDLDSLRTTLEQIADDLIVELVTG
ncbi:MAG: hypothetical protein RLZZ385_2643 [Pseudomonadota bacterium]|jgi:glycine cleavage system regulatory protein